MKSKSITILISINLFVIAFYFISSTMRNAEKHRVLLEQREMVARFDQQAGLKSIDDSHRLSLIRDRLRKQGVFSADDFRWLMERGENVLQKKHPYACLNRFEIAEALCLAHQLTTEQKEEAFQYAVSIYSIKPSPGTQDGLTVDKMAAGQIVGTLREKRGIPYLLPLLGDEDANVRNQARWALEQLGYASAKTSGEGAKG